MADFTDRIKLIFEAVTGDATKDIKKLQDGTEQSASGWQKLKGAAGDAVSKIATSPAAVAGAGIAIAKVAIDLASDFGAAALSAQNFATASGLAVEDASRWQEVAGDLGVDTATLEGAVNKLNIAASKGALEELGIGGETTNEQLLNAFEHLNGIQDSSRRAAEGAKIFGKSWAQLAPLVEESGNLRDNLAAVSDQKVIDEKEVAQARAWRDAIDGLVDRFDDLKLAVGGELIGALTDFAEGMGNVIDAVDTVTGAIPGLGSAFDIFTSPLHNVSDGFNTLTDSSNSLGERARGLGQTITGAIPGPLGSWASGLFDVTTESDRAKEAAAQQKAAAEEQAASAQRVAAAAEEAADKLREMTTATLAAFNSQLGLADASDKTEDAVAKYATAADTATASGWGSKEANDAAADAQREAEKAALAQAAAAVKLAQDQAVANGATKESVNANAIMADSLRTVAGTLAPDSPLRQSLLNYAKQIEAVPKTATTTFEAKTAEAVAQVENLMNIIKGFNGKNFFATLNLLTHQQTAAGGSTAGTSTSSALVPMGRSATPAALPGPVAAAAPRASVPSTVINVTVNAPPLTNPAEIGAKVADYLDAFYRRSGQRRIEAA